MPITDAPWTVSSLTQRIAGSLESFGVLAVQGELSQVKVAPSGHLYATLKDAGAVISLVMWKSQVVRNGPLPKEGAQVVVRGSLSVYGPRGQYQLAATRIAPLGLGDLAARFAALKAKLEAEGLFDEARKRPLPLLPAAIGLATASGSAALADLLHSIRARFPRMVIVHAPCLVQGTGAVAEIVAALRRLDADPRVEVIVVGRGGGSLEDLWAFNEEAVVRAIVACRTPVVSAVGHETDHTLADFAADLRTKTPTAAGELVVPIEADLRDALARHRVMLDAAMDGLIADLRQRLAAAASHRALAGPGHQVALRRQRLDELAERLGDAVDQRMESARGELRLVAVRLAGAGPSRRLDAAREALRGHARNLRRAAQRVGERCRERLAAAAGRLEALSPLAVIARGYSVVRDADGLLVRRLDQAPPGSPIEVRLGDGWLRATVTGARRQRLNEPSGTYDAGEQEPPP